jgi:transposase
VATVPVTGRADLTDAQWAVLEPLLPRQESRTATEVGQAPVDRRDPVADLDRRAVARVPAWYGPWQSGYGLFRRCKRDGTCGGFLWPFRPAPTRPG